MALPYDILFGISQFLPDKPRFELSLMNKDTFHLMRHAHLKKNFVEFISTIIGHEDSYWELEEEDGYNDTVDSDDERFWDEGPRMFCPVRNSALFQAINTPGSPLLNEILDSVARGETAIDLEDFRNDVDIDAYDRIKNNTLWRCAPRTWAEKFLDEITNMCRRAANVEAL